MIRSFSSLSLSFLKVHFKENYQEVKYKMSFSIYFNFQRGMFMMISCIEADNKSILTLSAISRRLSDLSSVAVLSLSPCSPLDHPSRNSAGHAGILTGTAEVKPLQPSARQEYRSWLATTYNKTLL